ncbi:FDLD family class I lanthipeptide [Tumebacillus flagellatus]|nr:FDLD family class I lanthipeptide [Tumebacillus flagellatus]
MENMFQLDVQVTSSKVSSDQAAISWTILETMSCPTHYDCA